MIARARRLWIWLATRVRRVERKYRKLVKYAAILGVALALICHFVPKDYQQICDAVALLCRG